MAYYLTIANKGEYKKLNLLLLEGFIKTSKFKGEALSLDELDDLTSKYQDEYEFKKKKEWRNNTNSTSNYNNRRCL